MTTEIKITPPGETQQKITYYDTCKVILSATDKAGAFSLALPHIDSSLIDAFPVGSDVQIVQDDNVFRGWVVRPAKLLDGKVRTVCLEGVTYTAKTQKIIVTESYIDEEITDIVTDLFTKYLSWVDVTNVMSCAKKITIRFSDIYLWDAMEQLCRISGYDWFIDATTDYLLQASFIEYGSIVNSNTLSQTEQNYKRGTANFTPDASKLVNKLWVKGGKATSEPYTQNIIVGADPIPLFYTPKATSGADVVVTIGGLVKTVGIQSIDKGGTKDFLLNVAEKLLIPDLCTTGTGTIAYSYGYPIKILLEDLESQAEYGLFEDILKVETDDKTLAKELGLRHLAKYSRPVMTGSIAPTDGLYKPGELIKIEIDSLSMDELMQIKEVSYESVRVAGLVNRALQLESPERDAANILKDLNNRLVKLEKAIYNDDEGPVEKYVYFIDPFENLTFVDNGLIWSLHQYHICGQVVCSEELIL